MKTISAVILSVVLAVPGFAADKQVQVFTNGGRDLNTYTIMQRPDGSKVVVDTQHGSIVVGSKLGDSWTITNTGPQNDVMIQMAGPDEGEADE